MYMAVGVWPYPHGFLHLTDQVRDLRAKSRGISGTQAWLCPVGSDASA